MMQLAVRALEWIALFMLAVMAWYVVVRVTVAAAVKSYYDTKAGIVMEDFDEEEASSEGTHYYYTNDEEEYDYDD